MDLAYNEHVVWCVTAHGFACITSAGKVKKCMVIQNKGHRAWLYTGDEVDWRTIGGHKMFLDFGDQSLVHIFLLKECTFSLKNTTYNIMGQNQSASLSQSPGYNFTRLSYTFSE